MIKKLFKTKDLCKPAYIYFVLSIISMLAMLLQNVIGGCDKYHMGPFSCDTSSVIALFIAKLIYIIFWTYVLNLICKDDNKGLAWLLVLVPYMLFFVLIGSFILL